MDEFDKDTLGYLRGCGCGEAIVERVERIMAERDKALCALGAALGVK